MSRNERTLERVFPYIVLAFCLYGGWAFYVNWSSGVLQASCSAVAQGLYSGINTYIYARIIEFAFHRIAHPLLKWLVPALLPNLLFLSILSVVHWSVGTEEISMTILPSAVIGTIYTALYTTQLHRRGGA